jgi:hypothetical protein
MRKVTTYPDSLTMCIGSHAIIPCVGISEFDVVMDEVADRLNARPSWRRRILEDRAQLPEEGVGEFTTTVWKLVQDAVEAVCAQPAETV